MSSSLNDFTNGRSFKVKVKDVFREDVEANDVITKEEMSIKVEEVQLLSTAETFDINIACNEMNAKKSYFCNICAKGFVKKLKMEKHICTHTTIKQNHTCSHCDKKKTAKRSLKTHMRCHSNKGYACGQCHKSCHTNSARVSSEQRGKMLEFMLAHQDLARGRFSGPEAARTKKVLLEELSVTLNTLGSGASKTPEKWMKCWQDWKSDTKAKALRIQKHRAETGGPGPVPLSFMEETLIQFWGLEIQGLAALDPLELSTDICIEPLPLEPMEVLAMGTEQPRGLPEEPCQPLTSGKGRNQARDDPLIAILGRQTAAIETLASGMHEMAASISSVTTALMSIAAAIKHKPPNTSNNES